MEWAQGPCLSFMFFRDGLERGVLFMYTYFKSFASKKEHACVLIEENSYAHCCCCQAAVYLLC